VNARKRQEFSVNSEPYLPDRSELRVAGKAGYTLPNVR
jgi:hypothetical protein